MVKSVRLHRFGALILFFFLKEIRIYWTENGDGNKE